MTGPSGSTGAAPRRRRRCSRSRPPEPETWPHGHSVPRVRASTCRQRHQGEDIPPQSEPPHTVRNSRRLRRLDHQIVVRGPPGCVVLLARDASPARIESSDVFLRHGATPSRRRPPRRHDRHRAPARRRRHECRRGNRPHGSARDCRLVLGARGLDRHEHRQLRPQPQPRALPRSRRGHHRLPARPHQWRAERGCAAAGPKADLVNAYNNAAGRPIDFTETVDLGGKILQAGVYVSDLGPLGITRQRSRSTVRATPTRSSSSRPARP